MLKISIIIQFLYHYAHFYSFYASETMIIPYL